MKELTLREEFFGGIIYDNISKSNLVVDRLTFLVLNLLNKQNQDYCNNIKEITNYGINTKEILELIREIVDNNIINSNLEYKLNTNISPDRLSSPFRIFYDITYLCNLNCKHCFTNSGKKHPEELNLEQKLQLVEDMKSLGVERVSIAGGEPFACADLFEFIKKCNECNIAVSISTNGTLFNKDNIERLNSLDVKTLTVSFDGGNPESMDFIRGAGSYNKVILGFELLKKYYKGKYSIKTTIMKSNLSSIENIIKLAIHYGCSQIKFNCVREDGRAVINKDKIILNQNEYIKIIKDIESLKKTYKNQISIKAPLNVFCTDEYDFISELGFGCFAGKESICVDPLGNVRPCSHFPKEYICGNIKEQSLDSIWNKSEVLSKFRKLEGNPTCKNCSDYNLCRGGCRHRAFMAGDINGIDPFCYRYINAK